MNFTDDAHIYITLNRTYLALKINKKQSFEETLHVKANPRPIYCVQITF